MPEPIPTITSLLEEAIGLLGQGALDPAEASYRRILVADPGNFQATHCLGVIQSQRGNHEEAARLIGEALRIQPRSAMAHLNLGIALWNLDRPMEALTHYQHSLMLLPGNPAALLNQAAALRRLGRCSEALASLDRYLALEPDSAAGHMNRGILLQDLDRFDEALASLDRAIHLDSTLAEAHLARGNAFLAKARGMADFDKLLQAVESYRRALQLRPVHPETQINLGHALWAMGCPGEALTCYEQALASCPHHPEAARHRGAALLFLKRPFEALASLDFALSIAPDNPGAWMDRGIALLELQRFGEAQQCFERAFDGTAGSGPTPTNPAADRKLLGSHEDAIARSFFRYRQEDGGQTEDRPD